MVYLNINYPALKNYIQTKKELYNSADLAYLLELGFINQQQYEDLMTTIHNPIYDYKNFIQEDKGYYRQPGPLNYIQNYNDITN